MVLKLNLTNNEREEVIRWISSSMMDRKAAGHLIEVNLFNIVVYHLQQASEKLLKTFLVANRIKIDKTQDIQKLLLAAIPIDPTLISINTVGVGSAKMADFATEYRYPNYNGNDLCDIHEVRGAVEYTDALYEHLKPFFEEAMIEAAILHAQESDNPFDDGALKALDDSITKISQKHPVLKP